MKKPIIALMTDFGYTDTYVGIIKGVILALAPSVRIIDLTHNIDPQNIKSAAFQLQSSFSYFPEGTIFLSIIDPGVGTDRKAIAFKSDKYYFVAPDNGILTYILKNIQIDGVYSLDNPKYHLNITSSTFHGRDIFAPIAAHLANGVQLSELGRRISQLNLATIANPQCFLDSQGIWHGEVIHIDHFGNVITSLDSKTLKLAHDEPSSVHWIFETGEIKINELNNTFGDVPQKSLVAYIGSMDFLEFAIREGNAANEFNIKTGDNVYAYKAS